MIHSSLSEMASKESKKTISILSLCELCIVGSRKEHNHCCLHRVVVGFVRSFDRNPTKLFVSDLVSSVLVVNDTLVAKGQ